MYTLINLFEVSDKVKEYRASQRYRDLVATRLAKQKAARAADPEYDAKVRALRNKHAATTRANKKARRAADPEYDAAIKKQARDFERNKMATNPKYADLTRKAKDRYNQSEVGSEKRRVYHFGKKLKDSGLPDELVQQGIEFQKAKGRQRKFYVKGPNYKPKIKKLGPRAIEKERVDRLMKDMERRGQMIDKWDN